MTADLSSWAPEAGLPPRVDNAPAMALARFADLQRDDDWAGIAGLLATDVECRDHRAAPKWASVDHLLVAVDTYGQIGLDLPPPRLLAMRGSRLGLIHVVESAAPAGPTDMVLVIECDDVGDVSSVDVFDTSDLVRAVETLGSRHIAGLSRDEAAVAVQGAALMTAIVARDLDAAAATLSPGFNLVDHRDGVPRNRDTAQFLDSLASVLADDHDLVDYITDVHAINASGLVAGRTQVSLDEVDVIDTEVVFLSTRDGRIDSAHFYNQTELPLALERLALLEH